MLALGSKTQAENTGEKDRFVKIIARHVLLDSTRYLLEELIDGLRTLGVYDKINKIKSPRIREVPVSFRQTPNGRYSGRLVPDRVCRTKVKPLRSPAEGNCVLERLSPRL